MTEYAKITLKSDNGQSATYEMAVGRRIIVNVDGKDEDEVNHKVTGDAIIQCRPEVLVVFDAFDKNNNGRITSNDYRDDEVSLGREINENLGCKHEYYQCDTDGQGGWMAGAKNGVGFQALLHSTVDGLKKWCNNSISEIEYDK